MQFEATILIHDQFDLGAWSWVEMPFDAAEVFGKKGNIPIVATVDSVEFKANLMPLKKGVHFLIINKNLQKTIKKRPGMTVSVKIEYDPVPRPLEIPMDLEDALENNAGAKKFFFETLAPSHRKGVVRWVEEAKGVETRLKRVEKLTEACAYWNKLGKKPEAGKSIFSYE
jgi:hypothetical protein